MHSTWVSLSIISFWILLFLTCGYALWRGRKYEQMSALVCILASVVSTIWLLLIRRYHPVDYSTVEISDLVVDTLVLTAFIVIALLSDRFWPLWVAGLQLTISMSHLLKAIQPDLLPIAYGVAERFWSYPILIILAAGTWRSQRRTEHISDGQETATAG